MLFKISLAPQKVPELEPYKTGPKFWYYLDHKTCRLDLQNVNM